MKRNSRHILPAGGIAGRAPRAFLDYWRRAFDYSGTSTKGDFAIAIVCNIAIAAVLGAIGGVLSEVLSCGWLIRLPNLYSLLSLLPTIAMIKRVFNAYSNKEDE